MHRALNIDEIKTNCTDESFKSMIEQCLSNKNESATVLKTKKFSKLNKV